MNDDFLIDCIENEIESGLYDFKKDIYDFKVQKCKQDFLIDVLSFANSHYSGDKYIITGVKLHEDNSRELSGISEDKIQDGANYQSLINENIEPNIIVDFKVLEYKGNKYGIFRINGINTDKPYLFSKKYGTLNKGFIKIRKGQKNEFVSRRDLDLFYKEKSNQNTSNILLKGIINEQFSNNFILKKIENPLDVEGIKNIIKELFIEIQNIKLEKSVNKGFRLGSKLTLDSKDIDIVKKYAIKNNIELDNTFFDIGDITFITIVEQSNFYGTESEKKKYKLLCELSDMIVKFEGVLGFYASIDKLYYAELGIENIGQKFDEDIEVILTIPKDCYLNHNNFPIPCKEIINSFIDKNMIDEYFQIAKVKQVNSYTGQYPKIVPIRPSGISLPGVGVTSPSYEEYKEYYYEYINTIADYEITEDNDYYYIKYNQKNIRPNEKITLPSRIFFKNQPEYIKYEIKTKYNPNVLKGKVLLEK